MRLREIREMISSAQSKLKEIKPPKEMGALVVVVFGKHQYTLDDLSGSCAVKLPGNNAILVPGDRAERAGAVHTRYTQAVKKRDNLARRLERAQRKAEELVWGRYDVLFERARTEGGEAEFERVRDECAQERATASAKVSEPVKEKLEIVCKRATRLGNQLERTLESVDFVEAQCELRFSQCDMEEIQRIKQHPLVQAAGRTDISRVSVRVVL